MHKQSFKLGPFGKLVRFVASVCRFALLLGLGIAGPAFAGPATEMIKTRQTALFPLVKQGTAATSKINANFEQMFDYPAMSAASLGSDWNARTDAEKAEYTALFKQLVNAVYLRSLQKLTNYEIKYTGEQASTGATLVKTTAQAKPAPIEIHFKLAQVRGIWLIQDIVTDGVSLVVSYRTQFTKILKQSGFPVLIQKMKDKLAKGDL